MKRIAVIAFLTVAGLTLRPATASADLTAFLGAQTGKTTTQARGFAVGISILVVGFEFEYGKTTEKPDEGGPKVATYMFNAMAMTPTKTQFYATIGAGIYSETLTGDTHRGIGTNLGAGIKAPLFGPLRLRLDYRTFILHGSSKYKVPSRFYAGLNLRF